MYCSPDHDAGEYKCIAENEHGSVERSFDVTVVPRVVAMKPLLKDNLPMNRTLVVGDSAELKCELKVVDPASPPYIKWWEKEQSLSLTNA